MAYPTNGVPTPERFDEDEDGKTPVTGRKTAPGATARAQVAAEAATRTTTPGQADPLQRAGQEKRENSVSGPGLSGRLPRMTDYAGEKPEYDQRRAKGLKWAGLASLALAGIAGLSDAPMATALMSGATRGLAGAKQNLDAGYQKRLDAYYDRLLRQSEYNMDQATKETEEAWGDADAETKHERQLERDEKQEKLERETGEQEAEREIETLKERQRLELLQEKKKRGLPMTEKEEAELEEIRSRIRENDAQAYSARQLGDKRAREEEGETFSKEEYAEMRDQLAELDIKRGGIQRQLSNLPSKDDPAAPEGTESKRVRLETELQQIDRQRNRVIEQIQRARGIAEEKPFRPPPGHDQEEGAATGSEVQSEIKAAREMVESGEMTEQEFEMLYGNPSESQ